MFVNSVTVEVEIQNKVLFNGLITKKNLSQPNNNRPSVYSRFIFCKTFKIAFLFKALVLLKKNCQLVNDNKNHRFGCHYSVLRAHKCFRQPISVWGI